MIKINKYWILFIVLSLILTASQFINWMWRSWSFGQDWIIQATITVVTLLVSVGVLFETVDKIE